VNRVSERLPAAEFGGKSINSPLIHDDPCVPPSVVAEITNQLSQKALQNALGKWLTELPPSADALRQVAFINREADRHVLALAIDRQASIPDCFLITGDEKLRRRALRFGIGFAALALILASVGIYGMMSYVASQRTREIGVRMAMGARPRDVLKLVVGQGAKLIAVGLGAGLIVAFIAARIINSLLFCSLTIA